MFELAIRILRQTIQLLGWGFKVKIMNILSKMTAIISKRLIKEVESCLHDKELEGLGIYYACEDANITKGQALIKGNSGTPYEDCYGLFEFEFPSEYPFAPPKVKWLTSDGYTRFHPQFYKEGKICLSILGNWSGPGWTSALNLKSILIILKSLFVENPLTCEPGYEKGTLEMSRYINYRDYVEHQFIKYMLHHGYLWKKGDHREIHIWKLFQERIQNEWPDIFGKLKQKVQEKANHPEQEWINLAYEMSGKTNWKHLAEMVVKIESIT